MMTNFENTFVRGASPSYSEDVNSENGRMSTLPIGDRNGLNNNFLTKSENKTYEQIVRQNSMKGRNTFAFWTLVSLLFILTVGNLLLTITIIGVLRLGKGMQSIEVIPEEYAVKFFGITDLDRVYKRDGNIEGFVDEPVSIVGEDSSVYINVNRHGAMQSKMTMDKTGTSFKGVNTFELKDPSSGEIIFSTHRPKYVMPQGAESLYAKAISTSRIASPIGEPLILETSDKMAVRGSEGLFVDAQKINLRPGEKYNIFVNTTKGSTILNGGLGVFLDMERIPAVSPEHGIRTGSMQYKICVCMPQGKLFRVPVPRNHSGKITCTHFNQKFDPCL